MYKVVTGVVGNECKPREIGELKKHLPNHMIANTIVYKQRLPLTSPSQGKIDKEALKKVVLEIS